MYDKKKLLSLSLSFTLLIGVAGCATQKVSLDPVAKEVKVIDTMLSTQQMAVSSMHCQLKGNIIAKTLTAYSPSTLSVSENELNAIKNQAVRLGADVVILEKNAIIYNAPHYVHYLLGNAYACILPIANLKENADEWY